MPKIKIVRERDWVIRYRVFEILMDGERIGYISNGETNEFEVPTGQHTLKVKMGRVRSKDLNYTMYSKETKSFTISRNKVMSIIIFMMVLLVTLAEIFLRHTFKLERKLLVFVPVLVAFIHFIARVHFLIIKED